MRRQLRDREDELKILRDENQQLRRSLRQLKERSSTRRQKGDSSALGLRSQLGNVQRELEDARRSEKEAREKLVVAIGLRANSSASVKQLRERNRILEEEIERYRRQLETLDEHPNMIPRRRASVRPNCPQAAR
mmetsp:Transcript_12668/g.46793  ORF Transcript_12668/g.46793 Transcript_12668/m.46793 type:complete len:134 (-) Transcript_12668:27-428(-)